MDQSTDQNTEMLAWGPNALLIVAAIATVLLYIAWRKGQLKPLGPAIKTLIMSIGFIVLLPIGAYSVLRMFMRGMIVPALITAAVIGITAAIIGQKIKTSTEHLERRDQDQS